MDDGNVQKDVDVGGGIEELRAQLDDIKKAQSGSDRRVKELLEENRGLKGRLEEKEAEAQKMLSMVNYRSDIIKLSMEQGYDPEAVLRLLDPTVDLGGGAAKVKDLSELIRTETDKQVAAEVERRFPKREKPKLFSGELPNYADIREMSDTEIARLPEKVFSRIMDNAGAQGKTTLRDKLKKIGGSL